MRATRDDSGCRTAEPVPTRAAYALEGPIWASGVTDYSAVGFENPLGDVYTDWTSIPLRLPAGTRQVALSVYDVAGKDQMDVFVFDDAGDEIDSTVSSDPAEWLPNGNFDIANFAWVGTPFTISSSKALYIFPSDSNYGAYDNDKIDQLFNQAIAELDPAKAADLANQVDAQMWTDMATLPLYQKPTFIAWRNTFGNIHDNSTSDGPFWNSETWGLKASAQ